MLVQDYGLDDLLGDYWLYDFVDMVVDVLFFTGRTFVVGIDGIACFSDVLESCDLLCQAVLGALVISVMEFYAFDFLGLVYVLFWEYFLVLEWLDRDMVVVLIDVTVDDLCGLLVTSFNDSLSSHSRSYLLVDSSI